MNLSSTLLASSAVVSGLQDLLVSKYLFLAPSRFLLKDNLQRNFSGLHISRSEKRIREQYSNTI